jgi:hypothetical protein
MNQVHMPLIRQAAPLQQIGARMRHEVCGGRPKVIELFTAVAGRTRRIRLMG